MSAAIAVSTTAPDRVLDLRLQIERMERAGTVMRPASGSTVSLGSPTLDAALPWGGLPAVGLHEVFGDTSAFGFAASLLTRLPEKGPILWCQQGRDLYGQGLAAYGLDPARLILVHGRNDTDTLWAMEEGLATPGLAAVVGLPHKVPPIAGRRLQLAAEDHGTFALLLRPLDLHAGPRAVAELAGTSMALTRWRVAAAPSQARVARGEIVALGAERWRLELQRCRLSAAQDSTSKYAGHPKTWQVEWHHETGDSSLWLPRFATDRLSRTGSHPDRAQPLATVTTIHGGQRLAAVNNAGTRNGLAPGLPLADARALCPGLKVVAAAPEADLAALDRLTAACERYTPWTSADPLGGGLLASMGGAAGIWLDVTGCTHLFGGEDSLLADLVERCARTGYQARAAMASTPGAAWAFARFGEGRIVNVSARDQRAQLAPLPIAALRLDSGLIEGLDRMGLRVIGDLTRLPRAPLAYRFGRAVLERLDQALGEIEEPISPRQPLPRYAVRKVFAEPIARPEDIDAGAKALIEDLCALLETPAQGVRRLGLILYRVDNTMATVEIGTSRPMREPDHLLRLLRDKFEDFDAEFGVEVMLLIARETAALPLTQQAFNDAVAAQGIEAARLVDRLATRLGSANVTRLEAQASHLPERACRERPVMAPHAPKDAPAWSGPERRPPRPVRLLGQPLPIRATALAPDGPPIAFIWRNHNHKIVSAEGPERIEPEWWQLDNRPLAREVRDYYRLEDDTGCRFWVYREGHYKQDPSPADPPPEWYIHGFFA